jgi:aryl-alcohol dehydrogenase-like predicted oxidoreductase
MNVMEKRRLGRLGHESTVLIFGAASLSDVSQDVADTSIQEALDAGINHFDTAAGYGESELRLGPWMPRIREQIFLATKTGERGREQAWAQINHSLERLQTDRVDLLQLHAVGDLDELDKVTGKDGALEAAVRARDEGLVGEVGITGHGHDAPATHREALRRFPFATVLTPFNYTLARDEKYLADFDELAAETQRTDTGLMIIKSAARRNWPTEERRYSTWYEPFDQQELITAAVAYVLSRPEVTGIATPGEVKLLRQLIQAESDRATLTSADIAATLDRADDYTSPFAAMPI